MLKYTVILIPEEEGGYSVEVPALPGCYTQGETREEAISMAKEAIEAVPGVAEGSRRARPQGGRRGVDHGPREGTRGVARQTYCERAQTERREAMDLTGKIAIVTGAGRGIGREIALRLAEAGATIVINDVGDPGPAQATVEDIKKLGRPAMSAMGDVSQTADVARIVDMTIAAYGKIDILVNNAGITRDALLIRMQDEDWDKVLAVDLKSVFLCTRAVMRHMIRQRWGRVVSISSIVGVIGNAGQANYASAKAGIIGFTKAIAKEVASRNVTLNAVAPGFIDTAMTQQLPEEKRQEMAGKIPAGYLGTARDVAEAVAFLASEEARYITGQVLTVDGGISLGKLS